MDKLKARLASAFLNSRTPGTLAVVSLSLMSACSPNSSESSTSIQNTWQGPTLGAANTYEVIPVDVGNPGTRPKYIGADLLTDDVSYKFTYELDELHAFYFSSYGIEYFENTLKAAGDVNEDGIIDFISTSTGQQDFEPTAESTLIPGKLGGWPERQSIEDEQRLLSNQSWAAWHNLVPLGDINGDNRSDIGVPPLASSSPFHPDANLEFDGLVLLDVEQALGPNQALGFDGIDGFRITNTDTSPEVPGRIIKTMHAAGDVNGDGLADMLVEYVINPSHPDGTNDLYLVLGSTQIYQAGLDLGSVSPNIIAMNIDEALPWGSPANHVDVGVPGDINGDGLSDLILTIASVPEGTEYSGNYTDAQHLVVYGRREYPSEPLLLPTFAASPAVGFLFNHNELPESLQVNDRENIQHSRINRFQNTGDINGDGFDDVLVVQSPERLIFRSGGYAGPAQWISLEWGDTEANGVNHEASEDRYRPNYDVVALGDVDGDNLDDFAIRHFYSLPNQYERGDSRVILFYGDTTYQAAEAAPNYVINDQLTVIDASGARPIALGDVDGDRIADLGLSVVTVETADEPFGQIAEFSETGDYNIIISLDAERPPPQVIESGFQIISNPGMQPAQALPQWEGPLVPKGYFVEAALLNEVTVMIDGFISHLPTEENPLDWEFTGEVYENGELVALSLRRYDPAQSVFSRISPAHTIINYTIGKSLTLHSAEATGFSSTEVSVDCEVELETREVSGNPDTCADAFAKTIEQLLTWR